MSYGDQRTPLTNFDKLAVRIAMFGAAILVALHMIAVRPARTSYRPMESALPGISKIVFSVGYTVSMALTMLFLAWYGARMRRLYDNQSASNILFLAICVALGANALLVYGVFAPTAGALDGVGY